MTVNMTSTAKKIPKPLILKAKKVIHIFHTPYYCDYCYIIIPLYRYIARAIDKENKETVWINRPNAYRKTNKK